MSAFAIQPEALRDLVAAALGDQARSVTVKLGEVTVEVASTHYLEVMRKLRDTAGCQFEQLIDLCGVDYSAFKEVGTEGPRFAVVSHLLSVLMHHC